MGSKKTCCKNSRHPNDWYCRFIYKRQSCSARSETGGSGSSGSGDVDVSKFGIKVGGEDHMPVPEFLQLIGFWLQRLQVDTEIDEAVLEAVFERQINSPTYRLSHDFGTVPPDAFKDNQRLIVATTQLMEPFLTQYGADQSRRLRESLASLTDDAADREFVLESPYSGSWALQVLIDDVNNAGHEPSQHRLRALVELLEDEEFEDEAKAVRAHLENQEP